MCGTATRGARLVVYLIERRDQYPGQLCVQRFLLTEEAMRRLGPCCVVASLDEARRHLPEAARRTRNPEGHGLHVLEEWTVRLPIASSAATR